MLEQRRAEEKGYITLKEAAELSNYSPDYIGQLIRAGKIKGEQVYSNVAWVTTPEEVYRYTNKKQGLSEQPQFFGVSNSTLHYLLYVTIGFLALCILVLQYILYVSIDRHFSSLPEQEVVESVVTKADFVFNYE